MMNDSTALAGPTVSPPPAAPPVMAADAQTYRLIADELISARRVQQRLFDGYHLSDPVWDMLLDLYLAERSGKRVAVSDLALATSVPRSTGLRWVSTLVRDGRIERLSDPHDGRRSWVRLTEATQVRLEQYFGYVASTFEKNYNFVSVNLSTRSTKAQQGSMWDQLSVRGIALHIVLRDSNTVESDSQTRQQKGEYT